MRKSRSPLLALLPATRAALLTATHAHPDRWWYLSELARELGTAPSSLQRELAALTAAGILERRADGNRVYFRAAPDCPLLPELCGLVAKTTGLVDVLRDALEPLRKRIRVACVHGSVARGEALAESDVDLLVVGHVGLAELSPALGVAADTLGRPVNPTLYPPEEFAAARDAGRRFIKTVLAGPLLFVTGNRDDLAGASSTAPTPGPPDRP